MSRFKLIRKCLALALTLFCITLIFVFAFATLQPFFETRHPKADMIVVLGGKMYDDGTLGDSSTIRVDRAVALFHSGAAPLIHFTGGSAVPNGPSAGQKMAKRAIAAGIPDDAITTENESQSTLQNALFSVPQTKEVSHIILVTEGYHLPRSWISFKLFGTQKATLIHARRFRDNLPQTGLSLVRESLAIWFNAARYIVWRGAEFTGMSEETRNGLLH